MDTNMIANTRIELQSRITVNEPKEESIRFFKGLCHEWYELFKVTRESYDASFGALYLFHQMDMLMKRMIEQDDPFLTNSHGDDFRKLSCRLNQKMLLPEYVDIGDEEEHWTITDLGFCTGNWEDWCAKLRY